MHHGHDGREPVSPEVNQVGRAVMDAAFAVHRELGPGLLESVYEHCLASDLTRAGLAVKGRSPSPSITARTDWMSASALIYS